MKDRHNLDELFKTKFQDFKPELDREGVWTKLNKRLGASNGRSVLFIFFLFIVLTGITVSATGVFNANESKNEKLSASKHKQIAHIAKEKIESETLLNNQVANSDLNKGAKDEKETELVKRITENSNTNLTRDRDSKPESGLSMNDLEILYNNEGKVEEVVDMELPLLVLPKRSFEHLIISPLSSKNPLLKLSHNALEIPFKVKKRKWSEDCKVKEPSYFYFSPYVSGLYTFQSISALSDASTYADKWKQYDEVLPGYAAGVLLGYELPNGLNVEAGLEWQQVFEKLLFYQMVTETIKVYSDSAYYWEDDNGVKQYYGDTISTERTYERKVQSLKRHNIWSIPVGIGYNFDFQRVSLGVQAGAVFHLDHQFKGRVYSPSGSFDYLLPSDKGKIYNPKLGITWFASLRMYFLQSDQVEWYIAPGFRYNRNSWLQGDTGLELFNKFGELKVGAKVYF